VPEHRQRRRAGTGDVSGAVLPLRPDVEDDHVAACEPLLELLGGERLHPVALAQVLIGEHRHLGHVADGDVTHRRPELGDAVAREPVIDPRALAPRAHQARPRKHLQMLRRVRIALADLTGDLLHRALALREQVDDLSPPPAPERLRHRRLRVEEGRLRRSACHGLSSYHLNTWEARAATRDRLSSQTANLIPAGHLPAGGPRRSVKPQPIERLTMERETGQTSSHRRWRPAPYDEMLRSFRWQVPRHYNIAADVLDKHEPSRLAMYWEDWQGNERTLTFGDMQSLANRTANALRAHGVGEGDRVAVMLPPLPEAAAAFLATY